MNAKTIFGCFLAVLLIAGCATAQTREDAKAPAVPESPEPVLSAVNPAGLDVKVAAWGASRLGKPGDAASALAIGPADPLDETAQGLPEDVRTALQAARKANEQATLVLLYAGVQPSPAYTIGVDSVSVQVHALSVTWGVNPPAEATGGSDVLAYPYVILSLNGVTLDLAQTEMISR